MAFFAAARDVESNSLTRYWMNARQRARYCTGTNRWRNLPGAILQVMGQRRYKIIGGGQGWQRTMQKPVLRWSGQRFNRNWLMTNITGLTLPLSLIYPCKTLSRQPIYCPTSMSTLSAIRIAVLSTTPHI